MNLTGKTKICALIGDPVEHTMSPAMQNAAFQDRRLDFVYVPFLVKKEGLSQAVAGFRALNVRGFNVTIPHKVAVIPWLDKLDPLASQIGAVNTVVNDGGVLTGSNTDAEGFLRALREHGVRPEGQNVIIVGAGGAARAIAYILLQNSARVSIVNRREELDWARSIAAGAAAAFKKVEVKVFELGQLSRAIDNTALLVNATSVGMSPDAGKSPVPSGLLKGIPVVFDIVYNPVATQLLQDARAVGAQTISGVDMLAWQGALAFEKWTGVPAPLELMRGRALQMLEGHED